MAFGALCMLSLIHLQLECHQYHHVDLSVNYAAVIVHLELECHHVDLSVNYAAVIAHSSVT